MSLNAYQVLKKARKTKGTNDKIKLFKENPSPLLQYVMEQAVSPFITFGVKQYDFDEPITLDYMDEKLWKLAEHCLYKLRVRQWTGNTAQKAIKEISAQLNSQQQHLFSCILDKDLACGLGAKNINKIIPGLVPTFEVQLASPYKDCKDKITFPCIAEIKRNGVRNISVINKDEVKHYSRGGIEQPQFSFLDQELLEFAAGMDIVLDGEVHGVHKDHTIAYKMAQEAKRKDGSNDVSKLRFTVFDVMPLGAWERKACGAVQNRRSTELLQMYTDHIDSNRDNIQVMMNKQYPIHSQEELEKLFEKMTKKGHEGLIVKNPEGLYQFKRSKDWIKMKVHSTWDGEIVDVVEGTKKMEGMVGSFIVDINGVTTNCPPKGYSHEELKKMWKKRKSYIGKWCEVAGMNITEDGVIYLPKWLHTRKKGE